MDIGDYSETVKRCYKCEQSVLQCLNIAYNASNTTIVLWNQFQIFIYENFELDASSKVILPDFQIERLLSSSNFLICLDRGGNLYVTSLKFKNTSQKRLKPCFQLKRQNILACIEYSEDHTLSLQCESNTYFLLLNKTRIDFQMERKVMLVSNEVLQIPVSKQKNIFTSCLVNQEHMTHLKSKFTLEENIPGGCSFIVLSLDKLNIYACVFYPKMPEDHANLVKLYTCPSEICSIEVIQDTDITISIGLTIGTILHLSLNNLSKKSEVIHLNTAIHKLLWLKNSIIYTDGMSMWKADINSNNKTFSNLFVKQVNDFIKFGDQIICTTFTNLIYTFQVDDESVYIKLKTVDKYCTAERLLNNTDYLQRIIKEVDTNKKLVAQLNIEGNYITALALANRQDIMDNVIICKATVYDNYTDVIAEYPEVKLTEDFVKYHCEETFLFLINVANNMPYKFNDILSSKLSELKLHVTMFMETRILKVTTVTVKDMLKELSLLIPLKVATKDLNGININIKLILNIPGVFHDKQTICTVLYRQHIKLNSEHFIKTNTSRIICLKKPTVTLEESISQFATHHFGNLFDFKDITVHTENPYWPLYLKLPNNYKEKLKNKGYFDKYYTPKQVAYFLQQLSSEDFYNCKSDITFDVNNDKVRIAIEDDGFTSPVMRISSGNMKIALSIKSFIANIVYTDIDSASGLSVNHTFYTTVENIRKAVQARAADSSQSEVFPLIEQFERHVIGALPI